MKIMTSPLEISFYLHIPFCSAICHYCDFAKTANHSPQLLNKYLDNLEEHCKKWLEYCTTRYGNIIIPSLYFGGGTPSLLAHKFAPIIELLNHHFKSNCEVSIECNPEDITINKLQKWRSIGINRISIGVQSFCTSNCNFLKRSHSKKTVLDAISMTREHFENFNIDLIYGLPNQTITNWDNDLQQATKLKVPHLSLYNLSYENRTVIGRSKNRGIIKEQSDNKLYSFYLKNIEVLDSKGYIQEEVSNWSLNANNTCIHNWVYWQDKPYIAIGAGAHGYLPDKKIGLRYFYNRSEREFNKVKLYENKDILECSNITIDKSRNFESWLLEYLGASLRTTRGTSITLICNATQLYFKPCTQLQIGLDKKLVSIKENYIVLNNSEFFREHSWALFVFASFS